MMKLRQIFTCVVCLLTFGAKSIMAQEEAEKYVMYSLTTTGAFPTDGDWTVPGGSYSKSGVNNSDDTQDPKRWTMKKTDNYIQCTCNQAIAEGDVIAITGTPQSTSTDGFCIRLENSTTAEAITQIKASGKKTEQTGIPKRNLKSI